ncbi:MAG: hypothetical protein Q8M16_09190 [Pirellulaceae bacterium]|nr:hypothetical protein [Pirellulaceae bacterium]
MKRSICEVTRRTLNWLLQFFPGLLLVTAGLAKVEAWIVAGNASVFLTLPNSISIPLVSAEILGGVGMLVYRRNVPMLYGATVLFATFTGVAVANIFGDEVSCGCFGRLGFSTEAMLLLNVLALLCLVLRVYSESQHLLRVSVFQFGIISLFAFGGYVGVVYFSDLELGSGFDSGGFAVVDRGGIKRIYARPQFWNGAELPILQFIENRREISESEYRLIVYRSDCHKCIAKIRKLTSTSSMRYFLDISSEVRIAGAFDLPDGCAKLQLESGFELIVAVPVAIDVKNGNVVAIVDEAD